MQKRLASGVLALNAKSRFGVCDLAQQHPSDRRGTFRAARAVVVSHGIVEAVQPAHGVAEHLRDLGLLRAREFHGGGGCGIGFFIAVFFLVAGTYDLGFLALILVAGYSESVAQE